LKKGISGFSEIVLIMLTDIWIVSKHSSKRIGLFFSITRSRWYYGLNSRLIQWRQSCWVKQNLSNHWKHIIFNDRTICKLCLAFRYRNLRIHLLLRRKKILMINSKSLYITFWTYWIDSCIWAIHNHR
jgi:hypothetical protein